MLRQLLTSRVLGALLLILCFLPSTLMAQQEAPLASTPSTAVPEAQAPTVSPEGLEISIARVFEDGGWLMYVLVALSTIGVALIVFFLFNLTQRRVAPREFIQDLLMMLRYHRFSEARKACEKNKSPSAAIALSGLDYIERSEEPLQSLLKEIIESEGSRQATLIQNQTAYLMDIAVVAPMVGLLGTVMGMLKSFNAVALNVSTLTPTLLVEGISTALVTTAGGLLVGIPAMIAYAVFRGRATRLIADMEIVSAELLAAMVKKSQS